MKHTFFSNCTFSGKRRPSTLLLGSSILMATLFFTTSCESLRRMTGKGGDGADAALAPAQYNTGDDQMNYIFQYKDAAIAEMERAGVPASIKLAQGILESSAGKSELAREANNHFGVKCSGSAWTGPSYKKKDDDRDPSGTLVESCFRKYEKPEQSFFDHSEFLRDPRKHHRYGFLFNLDRTDYKAWAQGLQSSGYATSSDYADKLINLIERYQLNTYDQPGNAAGVPSNPTAPISAGPPGTKPPTLPAGGLPANQRVGRTNDVKVVLSRNGESVEDIARRYRLKPEKVADYNERHYPPGVKLPENTRIFIQEKRSKWRGREAEHYVKEGQSMFDISQVYGVCLDKLLERNNLSNGQNPATGERIILRGHRSGPPVRLRETPLPDPSNPTNTTTSNQQPNRPATTGQDDTLFDLDGASANKPDPTKEKPPIVETPTNIPPPARPSTTNQPFPSNQPNTQPSTPTPKPPVNTQPTTPTTVPAGYHMVEKGDTLYNLARKYGLTVPRLKQMNNMVDDNIKLGQMLRVK